MPRLRALAFGGRKRAAKKVENLSNSIQTNDVDTFQEIISEDPYVLQRNFSLLECIVSSGNEKFLEIVVNKVEFFDWNVQNKDGRSLLFVAFIEGKTPIFRYLLLKKLFDANARDRFGFCILHYVCQMGRDCDLPLVTLLLDYGAAVNCLTPGKETPLHLSVRRNQVRLSQILIDNGASVNQQDANGVSVLMLAAGQGNVELCKMLLERDANPHLVDNHGHTGRWYSVRGRIAHLYDQYLRQNCTVLRHKSNLTVPIIRIERATSPVDSDDEFAVVSEDEHEAARGENGRNKKKAVFEFDSDGDHGRLVILYEQLKGDHQQLADEYEKLQQEHSNARTQLTPLGLARTAELADDGKAQRNCQVQCDRLQESESSLLEENRRLRKLLCQSELSLKRKNRHLDKYRTDVDELERQLSKVMGEFQIAQRNHNKLVGALRERLASQSFSPSQILELVDEPTASDPEEWEV